MCLELKIRLWFEYAKKYDLYGHENKISNTTIINKFNNKTEILNIFSNKKNNISSYYSLASTKCAYQYDEILNVAYTRDSNLYGTSLTKISHIEKSVNVTGLVQVLVSS